MFENYPDIMTVKQLASALGIGMNSAYELVNTQVIGSRKVGRKILIPKSCVIDFVDVARYTTVEQNTDFLSQNKEVLNLQEVCNKRMGSTI